MVDLYKVIGVDENASGRDIRRAYHKLALLYHPDSSKNMAPHKQERFKEITAAMSILADKDKRRAYDLGIIDHTGQENQDHHFAWRRSSKQNNQSNNHLKKSKIKADYIIKINFFDALKGVDLKINIKGDRYRLKVPSGVKEGQIFLMPNKKGRKGKSSLTFKVSITPHSHFERRGDDIFLMVPITPYEAVLGGEIEVPTVWGYVKTKIPKGTAQGQIFRLKGKGVIRKGTVKGDQLICVNIVMPSDEAGLGSLMKRWQKKKPFNPRRPWLKEFSSGL